MRITILFLLCFTIITCDRTDSEYPFVGKWAGILGDEYSEIHITADTIFSYDLTMDNRIPIKFKVREDSLHYITFDMVVRFQIIADSIAVFSNSDFSDTLFRLNSEIVTYDEIDPKDTTLVRGYRLIFYERSISYYRSMGYKDYWDYNKEKFDDAEEEILTLPE